jgi:hypothetical protein
MLLLWDLRDVQAILPLYFKPSAIAGEEKCVSYTVQFHVENNIHAFFPLKEL